MSKAIIISGGELEEGFVEKILSENEGASIVGVDRGVEYLYHHQIKPNYIVGDFDSIAPEIIKYYKTETNVAIREYNPAKDESDTEMAIRIAITIGNAEIYILGATGGRIDHLWANVQSLAIACKFNVKAYILDPQNRIFVTDKPCQLKKSEAYGKYLSVFSLSGEIFDFNMKGTKWPLEHHVLRPTDSLTVSNRFEDEIVEIDFIGGMIVVMETKDK